MPRFLARTYVAIAAFLVFFGSLIGVGHDGAALRVRGERNAARAAAAAERADDRAREGRGARRVEIGELDVCLIAPFHRADAEGDSGLEMRVG